MLLCCKPLQQNETYIFKLDNLGVEVGRSPFEKQRLHSTYSMGWGVIYYYYFIFRKASPVLGRRSNLCVFLYMYLYIDLLAGCRVTKTKCVAVLVLIKPGQYESLFHLVWSGFKCWKRACWPAPRAVQMRKRCRKFSCLHMCL